MNAPRIALFVGLAACSRAEPSTKTTEPSAEKSAVGLPGVDASELDPSAAVGDLAAEMAAFTTLDACVAARATVDPVLGDALEAIGDDLLARDACRALEAAKTRDATICSEIKRATLKARCAASVAELAGDPDACPFENAAKPELGRDVACLALASRDSRLCVAALEENERATCEAVARHDEAPCGKLPLRSDQARCARDERRWAAVLPAEIERPERGDAFESNGFVRDEPERFGDESTAVNLPRGVVLVEREDGMHFVMGTIEDAGSGYVVWSETPERVLGLEAVVPRDPETAADCWRGMHGRSCRLRVVRAQLTAPGHPVVKLEGPNAKTVMARAELVEMKRGGAIVVRGVGSFRKNGEVAMMLGTFVRDIVTASAMDRAPRSGQ